MKNILNKFISYVIVFVVLMSYIPFNVYADTTTTTGTTTATSTEPTTTGITSFKTYYSKGDSRVADLAKVCSKEQGTLEGMAFEASLMCNLFEIKPGDKTDLKDYVYDSGWFAKKSTQGLWDYTDKTTPTRDEIIEVVTKVIVEGYRTIPGYIDEHDCFKDLESVTTEDGTKYYISGSGKSAYVVINGEKQFASSQEFQNLFVANKSICTQDPNRIPGGSWWTFYCFPGEPGIVDPFGYDAKGEARRKEVGEFHYEYGTWDPVGGTPSNDDNSSAENQLAAESQANAESAEPSELDGMTESQKDAYMIITNKFMTTTELQAMEWNLIISQFAVPYKENIQDVWNHTAFKDMREKGLTIDDNPYITTIQENLNALSFDQLCAVIDMGVDVTSVTSETIKTKMNDIYNVMNEDGQIYYSPLYCEDGNIAYVEDMFDDENSTLVVHDKIATVGSANSAESLWSAMKSMRDDYIAKPTSKEAIATAVQQGSHTYDISVPVWVNTDAVIMYNAIFVANAIRVNGYGDYLTFIQSVGNAQLYMDRWGNVCANLRVDGEEHMCIVYPAYANPLLISTETTDDDSVGYVYEDFDDLWTIDSGYTYGGSNSETAYTIDPSVVNKTYKEIKDTYLTTKVSELQPNDFLGEESSNSRSYDLAVRSSGSVFAGTYSRKASDYDQDRDMVPIMRVDNTDNMLFNKAILSAYTRDSINKITTDSNGKTTQYDENWYGCFNDRTTSYTKFALSSEYNSNQQDALFSNSIVFDKYYVKALFFQQSGSSPVASVDADEIKGPYAVYGDAIKLDASTVKLGIAQWKDDGDKYSVSISTNKYITNTDNPVAKIKDTSVSSELTVYTMFPFMQMHSYRKGLYSSNPKLQPTKTTGFSLNSIFEDKYVSDSWKYENLVSSSKDDSNTYNYNEVYWNAMMADSDKFNTYIVFNYTSKVVPSNSSIYGLGNRIEQITALTKNKASVYYVASYAEDRLADKETIGKTYMSIALLDSTLDFGNDWQIWKSDNSAGIVNSTQDGPRTRTFEGLGVTGNNTATGNQQFFQPKQMSDSSAMYCLRYYLNDQRVSDVLENYPLEDITLLSFVWRNYYLPQTPFRTKLNDIISTESDGTEQNTVESTEESTEESTTTGASTDAESSTTIELSTDATEESSTAQSTVVVTNTSASEDDGKSYTYQYRVDSSESIDFGSNTFFDKRTALTPYNIYSETPKAVNNTLIWTNSCTREVEDTIAPDVVGIGSGALTGLGEIDSLVVGNTTIHRVSYNFAELLLAINQNTEGDNLVRLVTGYDATKEFDTDKIMTSIEAFFEHPVISLTTILIGFVQFVHNNVAVGNIGNVFDISWIIDYAQAQNFVRYYMIFSASICVITLIINGFKYMYNKEKKIDAMAKEWCIAVCISTIPVILFNYIGLGLNAMATALTGDVAGRLAAIEIEKEVASSENLNINFEEVYSAYKEQFADINDSYEQLALKVPTNYNESLGKFEYQTVTIKDLYDSIEYSNILAKAKLEASRLELGSIETTTDTSGTTTATTTTTTVDDAQKLAEVMTLYEGQNKSVNHFYYSYSEFVPVNYRNYGSNIFYYFYDYIKYQYLAYWASQADSGSSTYSSAAKNFTLPDAANQEKWSSYVGRMWDAERYMLLKSYNGMYIMMHDDDYNYNKIYTEDGQEVYSGAYPTDMFGLSNLFNMTDTSGESNGYAGVPNAEYITVLTKNDETENQLRQWQTSTKAITETRFENYGKYLQMVNNSIKYNKSSLMTYLYPLSYFMDNPVWKVIENEAYEGTGSSQNAKFEDYAFTPSYLYNYFENDSTYQYTTLNGTYVFDSPEAMEGANYLNATQKYNLYNLKGNRLPYRLYASKSQLYASTYNSEDNSYSKECTSFETKLMNCSKNIFEGVRDATEYLQGDIRDSSLIFTAALIATMEFNKEFSPFMSTSSLEPQGFTAESMDLDKFMRLTFANSMDEVVKNTDVMYMIYIQEGGIFTAIIVMCFEVCIAIVMLLRIGVLLLLFVGCAFVSLTYFVNKFRLRREMITGLLTQLLQVFVSQFVLIVLITNGVDFVGVTNSAIARVAMALIMLIACIAMVKWSLYMFTSLVKDFKNFGGTIIQGGINAVSSRLNSAFAQIEKNQQLKDIKAIIQNSNIIEQPAVATANGTTIQTSRRKNNSTKMKRISDNIIKTKQANVEKQDNVIYNELDKNSARRNANKNKTTKSNQQQNKTVNNKSTKQQGTKQTNKNVNHNADYKKVDAMPTKKRQNSIDKHKEHNKGKK